MSYVDGFVIPVPAGNRERYRAAAQKFHDKFKALWRDSPGRMLG